MSFSYRLDQLNEAAAWLLRQHPEVRVFAFSGPMGAGKTTLVQAICAQLGVVDKVNSPTFPIINEYRAGAEPVFHIDLYRLHDGGEAVAAGVEDALFSGAFCFVEWPEIAPAIFPENTVWVRISVPSAGERQLHTGPLSLP